jgi:hypothetical protein
MHPATTRYLISVLLLFFVSMGYNEAMPVTFTKLPTAKLDVKTGKVSGLPAKQAAPSIGKMSIPDLHIALIALAQNGVPLERAQKYVMQHEDITDKTTAARIVNAVYEIVKPTEK